MNPLPDILAEAAQVAQAAIARHGRNDIAEALDASAAEMAKLATLCDETARAESALAIVLRQTPVGLPADDPRLILLNAFCECAALWRQRAAEQLDVAIAASTRVTRVSERVLREVQQ